MLLNGLKKFSTRHNPDILDSAPYILNKLHCCDIIEFISKGVVSYLVEGELNNISLFGIIWIYAFLDLQEVLWG